MSMYLMLFAGGVFAVSFFTSLPSLWWLLSVIPLLSLIRRPYARYLLVPVLGVGWGIWCGHQLMQQQLPAERDRREFAVIGVITGLPQANQRRSRFQLALESCRDLQSGEPLPLKTLSLSWYGQAPQLHPGQRWQLRVRLRRPRGFSNPGGFDYQGWLLQQGVSATGYVRAGPHNRLSGNRFVGFSHWRFQLRETLEALPGANHALLKALVLGDSSGLSAADWQRLRATGTTHLLVISGLHVGLVALLFYGAGGVIGRLLNLAVPACPAPLVASLTSLLGAVFYAGLAGFGLPAVRAMIMLAVVLFMRMLRTRIGVWDIMVTALAAVALLDPLAIHSAGFWLSFGAVAALLWAVSGQWGQLTGWQRFWRPQWVVFVGLAGLLLSHFGELPLLSPASNAVAIPWVSLCIVPLCLLGVCLLAVSPVLAQWCWQLASWQLDGLWWLLGKLEHIGADLFLRLPVEQTTGLMAVAFIATAILLSPKGIPGRWLAILPLLGMCSLEPARSPLRLTVLDVGQGLAVVVQTRRHTLVYDTGARFSEKFDIGSAVVVPYLRRQGVSRIDHLIISHADNDHAGGADGVLKAMPVTRVLSAEPLAGGADSEPCREGISWQWGDVSFELLSPADPLPDKRNNQSCVLLIRYGDQYLLLPGDIEADVEARLLAGNVLPENIAVLIAPHHGSKTSSTEAFVAHLRPDYVLYSAGYRHQFGHPHRSVVARYERYQSRALNTAQSGAITLTWESGGWQLGEHRRKLSYFWQK